jgi:hypothetical protein
VAHRHGERDERDGERQKERRGEQVFFHCGN